MAHDQEHWTRTPGTRAGSTKAISQHKAIADGYECEQGKSPVSLNQRENRRTGCVEVPRMTPRR